MSPCFRFILKLSLALLTPVFCFASTIERDKVYGEASGETLLLNLEVPSGEGPFPIVILVHGGVWTGGDKTGPITLLCDPLAEAGFTWVSINYRLPPKHPWPASLDDASKGFAKPGKK